MVFGENLKQVSPFVYESPIAGVRDSKGAATLCTHLKVKYTDIAVRSITCHTAAGTRVRYRITVLHVTRQR